MRRWLHPQAPSPDEHAPYRIFTRAHDKIVPADQLDTVLGGLSAIDRIHFDKACRTFDGALSEWRTKAQLAALEASNHVRNALSDKARSDTVVTILVDHSGSMKGQSILLAAAAAEVATDFIRILEHCG
ncbi:cobaltochelatase CobT-related protein [Oleomonas cavernae]|uniref:cobaltochelatase CobT-related protein n=1 Tax=Oleomonas cavernae TaxID=2320859 RepID=UPI001314D05A|nr:hypothetical protein [Oleomonas cavernae]